MIEQAVFLLAGAASVAYFAWAVARRLGPIGAARDDLKFNDLGRRLRRVFVEVVLQKRVLRDRPVAGLLHALVLWGFLAFAWVSVEHLLLGVVGLDHAVPDRSWYGGFAAGWAAAVLVGILGLSFRRFVLRPPVLGSSPSVGSAVVAALIIALMATYLAGWRFLPVDSDAWRWNWWAHTAALFGMLLVIPNSKHLHLALGPVAIYFREGETISSTRALDENDDEDFGLLRFSDLSRKDILDVNACVECGRCSDVCPAHRIGGTLNPKEIVLQTRRGLEASENLAEASVAGTAAEVAAGEAWVSEEDLYQCYACGACEQACPVGIEHVGKKILDLRRGLVSEGRARGEKLTDLFNTMERSPHNPWGAPRETRRKLVEGGEFPFFDGSQEWLLWLGCGLNYDPHGNDVARAMKKLLDRAGVSWGVLKTETCCGEPARRAGNEYLYLELSEKVVETLSAARAKKVLVCDPHCCRMFEVDYRQDSTYRELGVEVVHHTEFLAEWLPRLGLAGAEEAVVFHDPCWLSRGRGVTEAPRAALETLGVDLVEMQQNRERSFCCGAGGAQLFISDDKNEYPGGRVNRLRFAQAVETGATTIAAACPYCHIMLKDAAQHAGRGDARILDVAEIAAARLPAES